jgi:hypothetical protein
MSGPDEDMTQDDVTQLWNMARREERADRVAMALVQQTHIAQAR